VVYAKASLSLWDGAALIGIYALYLIVLQKVPPKDVEEIEDLEAVPRAVMRLSVRPRLTVILAFFVIGGGILYLSAAPFLHSMLRFAVYLGVSEYLFIQWVAPFLSEFPEFFSMMYWARRASKAPMALMNLVSANINQWTMLAAMIPIVYSLSVGAPTYVPFDDLQRREILLTVAQSMLGMLLLSNMSFHIVEAGGIFFLWGLQFARPHLHAEVTIVYFAWVAYEVFVTLLVRRRLAAFGAFARVWRAHAARAGSVPVPDR
jgi:cation:H+ antiporter